MAPLPLIRQGGFLLEHVAFQPALAVIGKGLPETAHQAGIGVPQFRGFAQACAIGVAVQGKAATRLAQGETLGGEALLQVRPVACFAEINSEKSPQGIDEPRLQSRSCASKTAARNNGSGSFREIGCISIIRIMADDSYPKVKTVPRAEPHNRSRRRHRYGVPRPRRRHPATYPPVRA